MTRVLRILLSRRDPRGRGRLAIKVMADVAWVALAVIAAYVARFERIPGGLYGSQMWALVVGLPLLRTVTWRAFGVHAQSWRLFGMHEAIVLAKGTIAVSALLTVVRLASPWAIPRQMSVPVSVIAMEGLFTLLAATVLRVGVRLVDERLVAERNRPSSATPRRALLVGAGRAGRLAARELSQRPDTGYQVVGFLDDDPSRARQVIDGVRVLGTTASAAEVAERVGAELLILTMPSASRAEVRDVVSRCRAARLEVRTVPGFYELIADKVGITKIRPLRIEDLLGREVIGLDDAVRARVEATFGGVTVAVTGAGGSIGSELCRQLAALRPSRLLLIDNHENNLFDIDNEMRAVLGDRAVACLCDVRDATGVARVFAEHRPDVVFHAAAFKHVPMMELHPCAAVDNNVLGTRTLVRAAHAHGVGRFLFVSTDKAVAPRSIMGASKRVAEMLVQDQNERSEGRFSCVRFGNVLGSRGSVLHTFQHQIERGGPVTVTHPEVTRFFMTIAEAVRLVIQSGAVGEGGEVFWLDMGEPVRIIDLARQMIELAGLRPEDVPIEFIGLRPGEKLTESLQLEGDETCPSGVEGIMVVKPRFAAGGELEARLALLETACRLDDRTEVRRVLSELTGGDVENGVRVGSGRVAVAG